MFETARKILKQMIMADHRRELTDVMVISYCTNTKHERSSRIDPDACDGYIHAVQKHTYKTQNGGCSFALILGLCGNPSCFQQEFAGICLGPVVEFEHCKQ